MIAGFDGEASDGDDKLIGGLGNDAIMAGGGVDIVIGGLGNDYLDAGAGEDVDVHGNEGDDVVRGGSGNDLVHGDDGIDQVMGDAGTDQLFGDASPNLMAQRIFGGAGDDGVGPVRQPGVDACDGRGGVAQQELGEGGDEDVLGHPLSLGNDGIGGVEVVDDPLRLVARGC